MFLGHFGVGLASKPLQPRVSLGTLFLAAQLADLLWPTLLLLGVERVEIRPGLLAASPFDFVYYPFSHSLLAQVVLGLALGLTYGLLRRNWRGALLVGLLVPSHWLLDLIMHRPDLPLYFGDSPKEGLGLWQNLPATLAIELGFLVAGLWVYVRRTRPRNRTGRFALWGLVAFLVLVYLGSELGPPPGSVGALAWSSQVLWLVVALGYWVDANREVA
ncbi:hypothetical protein [Spirosoma flavum]|uniref:Metal-dependent hydrolase n=1 Tax=Spirosoma flavum TaxID=2048557 RepID=A0ABW6AL79_9BACT